MPRGPDEDGQLACELGWEKYNWGLRTEGEERIRCFQASEIFMVYAFMKGNWKASLTLGYLYAYDRCEGQYLGLALSEAGYSIGPDTDVPFNTDEYAYFFFKYCAEVCGQAEAYYKLGDMLRDGRGCERDPELAFRHFLTAANASRRAAPYLWGSAALRVAGMLEEGVEGADGSITIDGVTVTEEPNFEMALRWYRDAEVGLQMAVDSGDWLYEKSLDRARRGKLRMQQEVSGEY